MTTWPPASTPCTWKADLAISRPIVVTSLHRKLLRIVGSLISFHFFRTLVPVEEPSTASGADLPPLELLHNLPSKLSIA